MALKDRPYTDPAYQARQQVNFPAEAGGGATTTYSRWIAMAAGKIRNVALVATVAGTTTAHGFDIMNGTTSLGAITLGTSAAGSTATSGDLNSAVAVGAVISLKSKADTVGKALGSLEWHFTPGAHFNDP